VIGNKDSFIKKNNEIKNKAQVLINILENNELPNIKYELNYKKIALKEYLSLFFHKKVPINSGINSELGSEHDKKVKF